MEKCNFCNRKMKSGWNYCPSCGNQVNKKVSIFNLMKRQMDIMRNLMSNDNIQETKIIQRPRNAITIRIDGSGMRSPQVQVLPKNGSGVQRQSQQQPKRSERKLPENIIEPEVKIKRLAREMVINVPLPGVKSTNDVEVNSFTDSVELRAFAKDKGYFKILNIPQNHKLVEKTLNDGTLSLKFAI